MSFYCSYLKNILGAPGNIPQLGTALWTVVKLWVRKPKPLGLGFLGRKLLLIITCIFSFLPLEIQLHFCTKSFPKCDVLLAEWICNFGLQNLLSETN